MAEPVLCLLASCAVPGREHRDGCDGEQCTCLRAQAAPGLYLCAHHTDRIGQDLLGTTGRHHRDCPRQGCTGCADVVGLVDLYQELALRLAGGTGHGEPVSGTPDDTRVPNAAAVELRTEIRHVLVAWCRLISEERGFSLPADDVEAMGEYVARSATWLAATEYADEVAGELATLRRRAWGVAYPSGTRRIPVPLPDGGSAHCLMDGCDGVVWALLRPGDLLELGSWLMCDADDTHRWGPAQWHAFGRAVKGRAA